MKHQESAGPGARNGCCTSTRRRIREVAPGAAPWYTASTIWTNRALAVLDRAVGVWNVTGEHPYLSGRTLRGRVTFERIEGGAFVRMHSKMEDPEIPAGIA